MKRRVRFASIALAVMFVCTPPVGDANAGDGEVVVGEIQKAINDANAAALAADDLHSIMDTYRDAIDSISLTGVCNTVQEQYLNASLDWVNWTMAWNGCYYAYYLPLANGGTFHDVNKWLACVTPVNIGLVEAGRLSGSLNYDALVAPCETGFHLPDIQPGLPGVVYRAGLEAFMELTDKASTIKELKTKLAKGVKIATNPQQSGRAIVKLYMLKSTWKKIGTTVLTDVVAGATRNLVIKLTANGLAVLAGPAGPRELRLEYTLTTKSGTSSTVAWAFTLNDAKRSVGYPILGRLPTLVL